MNKQELRSLIREEIKRVLKEATGKGLEVIETGRKDADMGDELEGGDFEISYDVKLNGKTIGKMGYETYYGTTDGTLYGRRLPDIKDWTPVGVDRNKTYDEDGDMTPEGVKGKLIGFLKSKTGLKWLEVLKKQKPDAFMDAPELKEAMQLDPVNQKLKDKYIDVYLALTIDPYAGEYDLNLPSMEEIEAHAKKYGYENTLRTIDKHPDITATRRNYSGQDDPLASKAPGSNIQNLMMRDPLKNLTKKGKMNKLDVDRLKMKIKQNLGLDELKEDININDKSRLRELLIEAFMTGAYQSIKVLGEYDEPKLKKFAEEHADVYIKQMK